MGENDSEVTPLRSFVVVVDEEIPQEIPGMPVRQREQGGLSDVADSDIPEDPDMSGNEDPGELEQFEAGDDQHHQEPGEELDPNEEEDFEEEDIIEYEPDDENNSHDINDEILHSNELRRELNRFRRVITRDRGAKSIFTTVLPFAAIFVAKTVLDHLWSLICIMLAIGVFIGIDLRFAQLMGHSSSSTQFFIHFLLVGGGSYGVLVTVFGSDKLTITSLLGLHSEESDQPFVPILVRVIVVDCLVKEVTIMVKTIKRRLYQMFEYSSQFVRCIIPTVQWFPWITSTPQNPSFYFLDLLLGLVFVLFKLYEVLFCVGADFWASLRRVLTRCCYGSVPSREEIKHATICSICRDTFDTPIKMNCGHIFCSSCITEWVDREQTCPLCRQTIAKSCDDYMDGSTSWFFRCY